MTAKLIIAPEAQEDVDEAYCWYEDRRPGLGEEFLGCVDACIQAICRMPELHMKVHEKYRRTLVRRFPYAIFYEYTGGKVSVYWVVPTKQCGSTISISYISCLLAAHSEKSGVYKAKQGGIFKPA